MTSYPTDSAPDFARATEARHMPLGTTSRPAPLAVSGSDGSGVLGPLRLGTEGLR